MEDPQNRKTASKNEETKDTQVIIEIRMLPHPGINTKFTWIVIIKIFICHQPTITAIRHHAVIIKQLQSSNWLHQKR